MCDSIAPVFYKSSLVTARKTYKCCECRNIIPVGQQYERADGLWDGEFRSYHTCEKCYRRWNEIIANDSDIDKCHGDLFETLQFMVD